MNKLTLAVVSVAAAVVASVALAACGSTGSPAADDVASLGASTTITPDGTTPSEGSTDPQQAMLDYTQCMRDHGVDMPDPEFTSAADGGVIVNQVAGTGPDDVGGETPSFDPSSQQFKDADAECQPLLRDAIGSRQIDPEQQAEMREQMLAFAECMREHGIDFPDPVFSDDGGVSVQLGDGDDSGPRPDDPDVEAAMEECNTATGGPPMVAANKVGD